MCAIISDNEGRTLFAISFPYYYATLLFAVPPGKPYTSLEKIFFPFEYLVWTSICGVFIAAVALICQLKFTQATRRQFVLGAKNDSPLINMISIFLGGSVDHVPGRNFARTILLIWMSMSLILRSAYQGRLYHFIRTDQRSSTMNDLAAIVESDYKIYTTPKFHNFVIKKLPALESR